MSTCLLAQLSDPHIGADAGLGDPRVALSAAVDALRRLPDPPNAVLVSGDLAQTGADEEYEFVHATLAPLGMPVYVLPGNHDDPERLRAHFESSADRAADVGPLRLVLLDSTVPGEDGGDLSEAQLEWLDDTLAAEPQKPTILALHHPPFLTGMPSADALGIADGACRALADVVRRHPQLRRITAGHVHRAATGEFAGRSAMTVPSTFAQLALDFTATELRLAAEPPAFALHALVGEQLVSHFQPITPTPMEAT